MLSHHHITTSLSWAIQTYDLPLLINYEYSKKYFGNFIYDSVEKEYRLYNHISILFDDGTLYFIFCIEILLDKNCNGSEILINVYQDNRIIDLGMKWP